MRVTVIDYKAGNLTSVLKALRHLGAEPEVTDGDLALVESAERIVLPGVGHFAATERLDATGLTPAIRAAIARGVPFSASASACSGSMRARAKRPISPASRTSPSSARAFPKATKKFRTSAGTRSKSAPTRVSSPASSRANSSTSPTPTRPLSPPTPRPSRTTSSHSRPPSSAAT